MNSITHSAAPSAASVSACSTSSGGGGGANNAGYHQLTIIVEHASLRNNGIFKPNPYVELYVDNNKTYRKTEFVKHTYLPKWHDEFTVLVTPRSEIVFKVLDHSSFLKDALLGERIVPLAQVLHAYRGRCDNVELNMDLVAPGGKYGADSGRSKGGELVVVLDGMRVDVAQLPPAMGEQQQHSGEHGGFGEAQPHGNTELGGPGGGIRSRMRLRSATAAANGCDGGGGVQQATEPNDFVMVNGNGAVQRNGLGVTVAATASGSGQRGYPVSISGCSCNYLVSII